MGLFDGLKMKRFGGATADLENKFERDRLPCVVAKHFMHQRREGVKVLGELRGRMRRHEQEILSLSDHSVA